MTDDAQLDTATYQPASVLGGLWREVVEAALVPVIERLDRIERTLKTIQREDHQIMATQADLDAAAQQLLASEQADEQKLGALVTAVTALQQTIADNPTAPAASIDLTSLTAALAEHVTESSDIDLVTTAAETPATPTPPADPSA